MIRRGGKGRQGPIGAGIVLALFCAAACGFGSDRAPQRGPLVIPAGADAHGVPVGRADAPATVDIYLDLQCPFCKQFEEQVGDQLARLVSAGRAKVVYHPLAFLDRMSSTDYSSRAAASSGCAADAGVYQGFLSLLYRNQPPEGGAGLTDQQLIEFGRQAGAGDQFAACVRDRRYATWVAELTDAASRAGINGTPTVLVNGREIDNTVTALTDAIPGAR